MRTPDINRRESGGTHPPDESSPIAALRGFARNPVRAGRELRDALHADQAGFLAALVSTAGIESAGRGFRYAMILLLHNDVLIPAIANPGLTNQRQASWLTGCMLKMDPNFINTMLTAILMRSDLAKKPECTLRIIEIVREFVSYLGNWRSIARIHQYGDAQIKTQCARLIAQYRFEDPVGLERFCRAEARVRANIIEILWSVDKSRAGALLEAASQDSSNRVAGNAWLAYYVDGNARSLARLSAMLDSEEATRQVTAAWVMGETRDGRFGEKLKAASYSENSDLRRVAAASLLKLGALPEKPTEGRDKDVNGFQVAAVSAPHSDDHEVWLRVTDQAGAMRHGIRPIDFFVANGDEFLLDYSVEEMHKVHNVAIGVVYPAGMDELLPIFTQRLAARSAEHSWSFRCYAAVGEAQLSDATCGYETGVQAMDRLLGKAVPVSNNAETAVRSILDIHPGYPERHIVVIRQAEGLAPEPDVIRQACAQKNVRLHCWRLRDAFVQRHQSSIDRKASEGTIEPVAVRHAAQPARQAKAMGSRRFWEVDDYREAEEFPVEAGSVSAGSTREEEPDVVSGGGRDSEMCGITCDIAEFVRNWPDFVDSLHARYVLRASRRPTAVTIRNAHSTPPQYSRFSPLLDEGIDDRIR